MKLQSSLGKILLISLAVVVPGGGVVLAGYQLIKYIKGRKDKNEKSIHNSSEPGSEEHPAELPQA